ncbi:ASGL1 asparaginase, partial [Balaeniceps rex]|nr:ASGL1 asparaginase [Balaeniceps rex]
FGRMKPVIVVHGGAGRIFKEREEGSRAGVVKAALRGYGILKQGGSALDAVEEAVRSMEDDPHFNAGCGSVLNEKGEVEMDAIIMDGKNLDSGAVSAVKCIANPIKLARLVMEKTKHMLLTDRGAHLFAQVMGIPETPGEKLITERSRDRWKKNLEPDSNPEEFQNVVVGVKRDATGWCSSKTSHLKNKQLSYEVERKVRWKGKEGKSSGVKNVFYAFILFFSGMSPEMAADTALDYMKTRVGGLGGVIVVNNSGEWAARFSTKQMSWATVKDDQLHYGIYAGERHTKSVDEVLASEMRDS